MAEPFAATQSKLTILPALWLLVALVLNLAGGVALKLFTGVSKNLLSVALFGVFLGLVYLGRSVSWLKIGRRYQLSFAYPLLSVNYVLAYVIGLVFLDERFSPTRLAGCILIALGVLLLGRSRQRTDEAGKKP